MIEIRQINRASMPSSHWKEELEARFKTLNGDQALMIVVPRLQPYELVLNAFYKLAVEHLKKARTKKLFTEVGTTLFLCMK